MRSEDGEKEDGEKEDGGKEDGGREWRERKWRERMAGNKMAGENGRREYRKNLILNNPKIHQLITTDKQSHKEPVAKRIV